MGRIKEESSANDSPTDSAHECAPDLPPWDGKPSLSGPAHPVQPLKPAARVKSAPDTSDARSILQATAPVPIQRTVSIQPQPATVSPPTGPMSKPVEVKPRPRPGRKPMGGEENPADKRKAQNREAQRSFRDRRNLKLEEMATELQQNKDKYQAQLSQHQRELQDYKQRLEAETRKLEAEVKLRLKAEQRAERAEARNNSSMHATLPQPSSMAMEMETDFTSMFRKPVPSSSLYQTHDSHASGEMGLSEKCGFCTDPQNCICQKEEQSRKAEEALQKMTIRQPLTTSVLSGPGSCDACRADPAKAEACREFAKQSRIFPNFRAENGEAVSPLTRLPSMDPGNSGPPSKRARISCSTLVDRFNQSGTRLASIREILGSDGMDPIQLNRFASSSGGYEVEEEEAAAVLQNLSKRGPTAASTKSR